MGASRAGAPQRLGRGKEGLAIDTPRGHRLSGWASMRCRTVFHIDTAVMPASSEQLWDAIDRIYNEDGSAGKIPPAVIAKLIEFKIVELNSIGLPQLTPYRGKCFTVMESGDGVVSELNDMAAMEFEQ